MGKETIRIAILDDDEKAIRDLVTLLHRYEKENNLTFVISTFQDSSSFLFDYQPIYDVIFLDVQMPNYNGMQVAEEIRKRDKNVCLIFETQFGQYSLQGYKYNALDYFLKPVSYMDLKMRMTMVRSILKQRDKPISVELEEKGLMVFPSSSILYIEKVGRKQVFHTSDGKEYVSAKREGLFSTEEKLANAGFARPNSSFLLNLNKCTAVKKNKVYIGGLSFELSRRMKQSFLDRLFHTLNYEGDDK